MKYRPTRSKKWSEYHRNRRIIQEYGLEEARKTGALDSPKEQEIKKKKAKAQRKKEKKISKTKTGLYIGDLHIIQYQEFISNGGDPNSCPFD